tara:strand:- start:154 stop:513 length:360 start_codon:yes stop_codon:yes gene_type:complete
MDVRCPNNFLDESFGHQVTQEISSLIHLLEVAQRWLPQKNSIVHTSDLNSQLIMLHIFENGWRPLRTARRLTDPLSHSKVCPPRHKADLSKSLLAAVEQSHNNTFSFPLAFLYRTVLNK